MRIGIDAREIKHPDTGTGMYVLNLIKALADIDFKNEYFLFVDADLKSKLNLPNNFYFCNIKPSRFVKIQDQYEMARSISHYKIDLFHVTHHDVTPFLSNTPMVITVLDIAWIDFPSRSPLFQSYYYYTTRLAMRKARRIITISESTRQRVQHYFPSVASKIQAVPIACDSSYQQQSINNEIYNSIINEFNLHKPYILYVGSFAIRKNLSVLIKAMRAVWKEVPDMQLVLAGKPSGRNDTPINELSDYTQIVLISRSKSQAELKCLYSNAEMLVFPSLYEGFGLPVLEAMSSGCPVIVANSTSLPEIVGDAGLLIDPYDVFGLSTQIFKLIRDRNLRESLISGGLIQSQKFNWNVVAQQTLDNYLYAFNTLTFNND